MQWLKSLQTIFCLNFAFLAPLTTESQVSLVKPDLPGVLLDEGEVCFAHVIELECKKSLSVVPGRLLDFGGVLWTDHAVLQFVIAAHRVL